LGQSLIQSLDEMLKQEEDDINLKRARKERVEKLGFFAAI
jgi:hypothetical protein